MNEPLGRDDGSLPQAGQHPVPDQHDQATEELDAIAASRMAAQANSDPAPLRSTAASSATMNYWRRSPTAVWAWSGRPASESAGRIVALKMIKSGALASEAELRRFRSEAEAAAQLDHPNIVPIYEVGEHEGLPYFSMKLVEGGNLNRLLARPGPNAREAARLVEVAARAVHHAHQRGILHRDLKPANVLLDARRSAAGHGFRPGEAPGGRSGPDAIGRRHGHAGATWRRSRRPARTQAADDRGDVYALGAILYELPDRPAAVQGGHGARHADAGVVETEPAPPRRLAVGHAAQIWRRSV